MLTFTYFATPHLIGQVTPACGPVKGYTQITVKGKNFNEFGDGTAKCVFNATYFMNATVLDLETIACDTPPLESTNGDMFYNVSVTLDGTFFTNATGRFNYYKELTIDSVTPSLGPLEGGTQSLITGSGFNQSNVCDLRVRYGQIHQVPSDVTKNSLTAYSP